MKIKKLVCSGDSITYGYGVIEGYSWFSLLSKKMSFPMINEGANGAGLSDILHSFKRDILPHSPSHVLFFAGLNDIIVGEDAARLTTKIERLTELSKENNIQVFWATLITPRPHVASTGWIYGHSYDDIKKEVSSFNTFLRDFTKREGLLLFDFDLLFKEGATEDRLFPDGIHPGAEAHGRMAEYMEKLLEKL